MKIEAVRESNDLSKEMKVAIEVWDPTAPFKFKPTLNREG